MFTCGNCKILAWVIPGWKYHLVSYFLWATQSMFLPQLWYLHFNPTHVKPREYLLKYSKEQNYITFSWAKRDVEVLWAICDVSLPSTVDERRIRFQFQWVRLRKTTNRTVFFFCFFFIPLFMYDLNVQVCGGHVLASSFHPSGKTFRWDYCIQRLLMLDKRLRLTISVHPRGVLWHQTQPSIYGPWLFHSKLA